MRENVFQMGGSDGLLSVEIVGYERPNSEDYSDANWLKAKVSLVIGGVDVEYDCTLQTHDLEALDHFLTRLAGAGESKAHFETVEQWLAFSVDRSSVSGRAKVVSLRGRRCVIEFEMPMSESGLQTMTTEVEAVTKAFPVLRRK